MLKEFGPFLEENSLILEKFFFLFVQVVFQGTLFVLFFKNLLLEIFILLHGELT
jgi:hypothetical protein